jgi:pimeloyl-ACP methyl ester carboxylesterase
VLLMYGKESWATDPSTDGRSGCFKDSRVLGVEGAGHWVHHDRLELFLEKVGEFLR